MYYQTRNTDKISLSVNVKAELHFRTPKPQLGSSSELGLSCGASKEKKLHQLLFLLANKKKLSHSATWN